MNNKEMAGKTIQDVGICILLVALLLSAIVFALRPDHYMEGLLMMIGVVASVLFAFFQLASMSIIVAGLATVAFAAFKLYEIVALGTAVEMLAFAWVILPAMAVTGGVLYANGLKKIALENQVLRQQVEELVMIDPLTGFYNLRSMFMDIQTQISYAERNGKAISLMIIQLRYLKELKTVLKKSQYEEVIKRLSKIAYDCVRLEDRVYSIDDIGSLGIILTCDKAGTRVVEKRLRDRISAPEAFDGIAESPIRVEVKIGCLQYKKEEFQRDAILLKERVEDEVAYDI